MSRAFSEFTVAVRAFLALSFFCLAGTDAFAQSEETQQAETLAPISNPAVKKQETDSVARDTFAKIGKITFQIKTSVSSDSAKASYGTGFVIDTEGLIATNFHVVQDAVSNPKQYRTFLVDGEKITQATVVAIDAINDLAILKADQTYDSKVEFADQLPQKGAAIFSMGVPEDLNESIIQGIYNGPINEGPYKSLLTSSPLNSGMSGGPTVNAKGRLIGINVAIYRSSQNISFSVPYTELIKLKQYYHNQLESGSTLDLTRELNRQLHLSSQSLTENYLQAAKSGTITVGEWITKSNSPDIKCWSPVRRHRELWTTTRLGCRVQGRTQLHDNNYGGSYHLDYYSFVRKEAGKIRFFSQIEKLTGQSGESNTWNDDYYTRYTCEESTIKNPNDVLLRVNFCFNQYIRFKDVYDAHFRIMTLGSDRKVLYINAEVFGFRLADIKEILSQELNGIGEKNVSNTSDRNKTTNTTH